MIEVTYIDHMGSDLSVVNAARVSFGKKSDWLPRIHNGEAKALSAKDCRLIEYLARHNHKSPFNHTFTTFHVKAPVFVARQLVKHEYMPWNEISRRYVDSDPEFYEPDQWRGRSADKKQGSEGVVTLYEDHQMRQAYHPTEINVYSLETYNYLLEQGVAPEQARMVLPQSMMTEWYWSGTVFSFAKMCSLRCKDDTQAETRVVADAIDEEMENLYPMSWEALREYM
jgi:thymidylate synthase (FAD)